jgi:hypothetical protein
MARRLCAPHLKSEMGYPVWWDRVEGRILRRNDKPVRVHVTGCFEARPNLCRPH